MAPDMRTTPTFILEQSKRDRGSQFACSIRNHTANALSLTIPFGSLENQPTMTARSFARLISDNRTRISMPAGLPSRTPHTPAADKAAPRPATAQHEASAGPVDADDWNG
jgi:hypothetical protein